VPVVPARVATQTEVSWLAASAVQLLAPPASSPDNFTALNFPCIAMGQVPIFQRNCAYLI